MSADPIRASLIATPIPVIPEDVELEAQEGVSPSTQVAILPQSDREDRDRGDAQNAAGSGENSNGDASSNEDIPTSIRGIHGEIPASELGDLPEDLPSVLPSLVFLIPLPPPVHGHRSKSTTPFLIYSPPRLAYEKPPKNEEGKPAKEKFMKRVVRCYQKEVRMGEQLKRKEYPNTGKFPRIVKARGACIRGASTISKWLPTSCVETLARLPPKHKLANILVLCPAHSENPSPDGMDQPYQPTEDEVRHDLDVLLRRTRRRVMLRLIAVSCFMPIAAGIDFFAPVFSVEIAIAYLAFQVYGLRKVNAITAACKKPKKVKTRKPMLCFFKKSKVAPETEPIQPTPDESGSIAKIEGQHEGPFSFKVMDRAIFDPISILLYKICSRMDHLTFPPVETNEPDAAIPLEDLPVQGSSSGGDIALPPNKTVLPPTLHKPSPDVVREIIKAFRENLPDDVQQRYNLEEDSLSQDLARCLKKAAAEYIGSLKGRPQRSPLKVTQKWFSKRSLVRQERKQKKKVKKQIKAEKAAAAALIAEEAAGAVPVVDNHEEPVSRTAQEVNREASESNDPKSLKKTMALKVKEEKALRKQQANEQKLRKKEEKAALKKGKLAQ